MLCIEIGLSFVGRFVLCWECPLSIGGFPSILESAGDPEAVHVATPQGGDRDRILRDVLIHVQGLDHPLVRSPQNETGRPHRSETTDPMDQLGAQRMVPRAPELCTGELNYYCVSETYTIYEVLRTQWFNVYTH